MKRIAQLLAVLGGSALVLMLVAAVVLPRVVDPNQYKPQIVAAVERELGRKLIIPGDIEMSVFPWLGVRVGSVRLDNPEGFAADAFAAIEELRVRVRIVPLLSRKVEADVVTVRGLQLHLERDAQGRTNWQDLAAAGSPGAAGSARQGGASPLAALAVGGIEVQDATLRWTDHAAGRRVTIRKLNVNTSEISLFRPVRLQASFEVQTEDPQISGRIEGRGRLDLQLRRQRYVLRDLAVAAELAGDGIPGGRASLKAGGEAGFDAFRQELSLDGFRLEVLGLSVPPYTVAASGSLNGRVRLEPLTLDLPSVEAGASLEGDGRRLKAVLSGHVKADLGAGSVTLPELTLAVPELEWPGGKGALAPAGKGAASLDLGEGTFRVDWLSLQGDLSLEGLPSGKVPVRFAASAGGDWKKGIVHVDPLGIQVDAVKGAGKLRFASGSGRPQLSGSFGLDSFNPRQLLTRLGVSLPAVPDPASLTAARLFFDFGATAEELHLANLHLAVDDSLLVGAVRVRDFASPAVHFDLRLNGIELDRYRPVSSPEAAAAAAAPAAGAALLPVEALRKMDLNGSVGIGRLVVAGVRLDDTRIALRAEDGRIRTDPVETRLYGGRFRASAELDVRGGEPRLTVDESLSDVRLDRLLADLGIAPLPADLSGASSLSLKGSITADPGFGRLSVETLAAEALLAGTDFGRGSLPLGAVFSGTVEPSGKMLAAGRLSLKVAGMELQATDLQVQGPSANPSFSASLQAPAFNLRGVLQRLGRLPETADPGALTTAALSAAVSGSKDAVAVPALSLRLDDSRAEGRLDATFRPASGYAFDIRVDGIDLDRYLPPPAAGSPAVAATPGAAAAALPVEALRRLTMDGKLSVGKLKAARIRLSDLTVVVGAREGQGVLEPLTAKLYGGTYTGNIRYDARGEQLRLVVDEALAGVQAGPLLEDLRGKAVLTGRSDLSLKLSTAGADTHGLLRSLEGSTGFVFQDGAILGVDILGTLCRTLTALAAGSRDTGDIVGGALQMLMRPSPRPEAADGGGQARTEFSELKGTMVFSGGVGVNRDLLLQSPLLRVEGAGRLNLPDRSLDYGATAAVVESCEGQGGKGMRDLANYPIPVRISGPLDDLRVQPDITAGILEILRRRQARQAPAAPQQTAESPGPQEPVQPDRPAASESQAPPGTPEEQAEEAVRGLLRKGLQDLFKKE